MAYTQSNEIKTRIALKYDSYENWMNSTFPLLRGELAIAYFPPSGDNANPAVAESAVMFKIGEDGVKTFKDLPWASSLAADVYGWAKAATKPSYTFSEISGREEYKLTKVSDNSWKLQKRVVGTQAWNDITDSALVDIQAFVTRISALEGEAETLRNDLDTLTETVGDNDSGLVKKVNDLSTNLDTTIGNKINTAIQGLDNTVSQTAGTDGLALEVTQENGIVTGISGSIKANTYEKYGEAAKVLGTANDASSANTVYGAKKLANEVLGNSSDTKDSNTVYGAKKLAQSAIDSIAALDFGPVEGTQNTTIVKFVDKVGQTNGVVSAELGEINLKSAQSASNPIITESDLNNALDDIRDSLTGGMHFIGVVEGSALPATTEYNHGDVIALSATGEEYVLVEKDGVKEFVRLGDDNVALDTIKGLTLSEVSVGANETTKTIKQANGAVSYTKQAIQIGVSQVTGLQDRLDAIPTIPNVTVTDDNTPDDPTTDVVSVITDLNASGHNITATNVNVVTQKGLTNAIAALDKTNAAQAGKYIKAITQTDGIVTAEYGDLPTIPSITITDDNTPDNPTSETVSVIQKLDENGHAITATNVNVATKAGVTKAIEALDSEVKAGANQALASVTQENGLLKAATYINVSTLGQTGNIGDATQTANTYVLFNCGSATDVI